ncbi:DUF2520 domain-containing protein [Bifidobacterium sp. 82T24]|uniref:DUF2520 domain-containing protein n=1 Tax=Bifidobacterium saimiriisciurei TaxID=2661627 RepID=A0ABX0CCA1_9BIFI|nr:MULTISPECIES: Rossmann-like and DUF2520 domain-containing protein [Bifidobacterium]MBW3088480.1 DUF2520 domain-containing protein [Bifidobacterium pluvialisilvae]NEG96574.1 DUF2520 domain-containing protein [Bifidobacterium sp. SMB2]NEH10509.1 DUF2520 domain-containing protein [Bifidobacterium saimiriisciurei]NEH10708.1 DUF2520 domain-containing protein [Bifidobacterium saimiriisciurei]
MRIGFVGAGKVGCALGAHLRGSASVTVSGYCSRSMTSSQAAADALNAAARQAADFDATTAAVAFPSLMSAVELSDMLIVTTPDDAIAGVWHDLRDLPEDAVSGMAIGHCSGCLSSRVFDGSDEAGVSAFSMHPMQAVSERFPTDGRDQLAGAFFALEGDARVTEAMSQLLASLGNPNRTMEADSKTRYHAAAVMASNLPIALWNQAVETLRSCGFGESDAREALSAMIRHNADSFCERGAKAALTGPVERADAGTVEAHLKALPDDALAVYRPLSQALIDIAAAKNPNRDYDGLRTILSPITE